MSRRSFIILCHASIPPFLHPSHDSALLLHWAAASVAVEAPVAPAPIAERRAAVAAHHSVAAKGPHNAQRAGRTRRRTNVPAHPVVVQSRSLSLNSPVGRPVRHTRPPVVCGRASPVGLPLQPTEDAESLAAGIARHPPGVGVAVAATGRPPEDAPDVDERGGLGSLLLVEGGSVGEEGVVAAWRWAVDGLFVKLGAGMPQTHR
mmetsp:Transcript_3770/g.9426  ORF Transcript_3770/g.9426 Transcript_3770/m.9426 type:complete len:204 (+) Transcript_3770:1973-2584(+)